MSTHKDEKNGTWYVMVRYHDWKGEKKQKCKRGFATKRDAQEWERTFLLKEAGDLDMTFEAFLELYERDMRPRLKENTWLSKEHMIRTKLLPYFGMLTRQTAIDRRRADTAKKRGGGEYERSLSELEGCVSGERGEMLPDLFGIGVLCLLLPGLADPVAALLGLSEDRSGLRLGVSLNMCDDLFSAFHSFSHPMPIRC